MPNVAFNNEAEWLALREMNIGGSEAAALFSNWLVKGERVVAHAYEPLPENAIYLGSCSPYQTAHRVFLGKTGKVMPDDFSGERIQAGNHLEPAIAGWAQAKWGMKLRKVRRYSTHPTIEGWGASVDYEVHGPGMDPVEIKNVDAHVAKQLWIIEGDEVITPPLHITLQLQHYLGARNAQQGWIIACVGGNQLVRGLIKRHDPTIERIGDAISAFWTAVKLERAPIGVAEFDDVSEEFAIGGGEVVDLTGDLDAERDLRRYLRIQRHADFTDKILSNIKARVASKVGGNSKAFFGSYRVSWPVIHREEKMIPARLQAAKTYRGGFTVSKMKEKKS